MVSKLLRDFPGGSVGKTLCFHSSLQVQPLVGELRAHMPSKCPHPTPTKKTLLVAGNMVLRQKFVALNANAHCQKEEIKYLIFDHKKLEKYKLNTKYIKASKYLKQETLMRENG